MSNAALRRHPAVYLPSEEELQKISDDLRLKCTKEELADFRESYKSTVKQYQTVYDLEEDPLPVKYPRTPGVKDSDPAWTWRCNIKGADSGLLLGRSVGIKDNVAVSGVPMMNGTAFLEGYTPEYDATVVTRILDAGGVIAGKTTCEDLCLSGNSWTSVSGPVPNPHDKTKSAGGSSSGSGSLVARGVIDMAIGGDQGGSIRIPASWCGIVGLKATFGLVPYTGALPIEPTLDHLGPMARTVQDCALLLQAIAGYDDGTDPRQMPNIAVPEYSKLVDVSVAGKKVGLVTEGFDFQGMEADVAEAVREAAGKLTIVGAKVEDVSVPLHKHGLSIWSPVLYEGGYKAMIKGNGFGYLQKGHYCLSALETLAAAYNLRPHDFSMPCKYVAIFAEHIERNYQNKFYAKAQNLNRRLTKAYNDALKTYDVLIMPTLPTKPLNLPLDGDSVGEAIKLTFDMIYNTAPFDSTGHPALTINVNTSGPPIGMMLIGKHHDEVTILQVARAFEKLRDGK